MGSSELHFRRCLLVVAAPIEAGAILGRSSPSPWSMEPVAHGLTLVVSGIGKANAAGATARFGSSSSFDAIVSVGIAGALAPDLMLGDVVIAEASVFADEGVQTPGGFRDCAAMGFPLGDFPSCAVPPARWLKDALSDILRGLSPRLAPIATVSTCSGTDALAAAVRERTGAAAEAMEGAAVGLVAHRLAIPFAEVRVVSNTTGDRGRQRWDMPLALSRLHGVIGPLAQRVRG